MYTEDDLIDFAKLYAKEIVAKVVAEYDSKISRLQSRLKKERETVESYKKAVNMPTSTQNENYRKTAIRLKKERDYYKNECFKLKMEEQRK